MSIKLQFRMVNMKLRFLDRPVADTLAPITRRFFMRAGGAIRMTARRSLRNARRMRLSELPQDKRRWYREMRARHRAGQIPWRPELPDAISKPGEPPRLHQKPQSLLKSRLFFALSPDRRSVVIGPEAIGRNKRLARTSDRGRRGLTTLYDLEQRRPFMEPAFQAIEPRLFEFMAAAR